MHFLRLSSPAQSPIHPLHFLKLFLPGVQFATNGGRLLVSVLQLHGIVQQLVLELLDAQDLLEKVEELFLVEHLIAQLSRRRTLTGPTGLLLCGKEKKMRVFRAGPRPQKAIFLRELVSDSGYRPLVSSEAGPKRDASGISKRPSPLLRGCCSLSLVRESNIPFKNRAFNKRRTFPCKFIVLGSFATWHLCDLMVSYRAKIKCLFNVRSPFMMASYLAIQEVTTVSLLSPSISGKVRMRFSI